MYFRFSSALFLVVVISLLGASLEKRSLELRRDVTRQKYQMDVLRDTFSRKRLQAQQLGAPNRTIRNLGESASGLFQPDTVVGAVNASNRIRQSRKDPELLMSQ